LRELRELKGIEKKRRLKMEKGVCSWCAKPGIISYVPVDTNFRGQRMDIGICVEDINARIMAHKLIKIEKGVFACKECVYKYGLRPTES
jgi:hypothetical protein